MNRSLRNFLGFIVVCVGFSACLWAAAYLARPNVSKEPTPHTPEEIEQAERDRDVRFDPNDVEHLPTLHRNIKVEPKNEAPILAELVKDGQLPPLKDRMPEEPVVMEGCDGYANYGGTWMRLASAPGDADIITYRMSGSTLVRWSPLAYPIEMHLAKSVEPSPDKRVWTVTLRKGLKWSDGEPFTTDDMMYWWKYDANNKLVNGAPPQWMRVAGEFGDIKQIDKQTVQFIFKQPYARFLEQLAMSRDVVDAPEHYLRQFNPDPNIGNKTLIDQKVREWRLASAAALYRLVKNWQNPECPRMWPWVYRTFKSSAPQIFVRNPYYYVVDPKGNQLPYVDRVQFDVQAPNMIALTAGNGGVSMQGRHLRYDSYTELMSRRDRAGINVYQWYSASRSVYVINPNLNRLVKEDEPATKWKAKLLADKRFRQALSLAINRQQIIDADYNGQAQPSQVAPGPESPFRHDKLAKAFIEYDPKRANALLDEIGLTPRDDEGYRTFPDGSRMLFNLDLTSAYSGVGPAQFIVDDWAAVGVRTIFRDRNRPLFYAEKDGMDFDFNVWSGESDMMPLQLARYFIPHNTESFYAVGWAKWYSRGGFYDSPESKNKTFIPVPKDSPMYEAVSEYELALKSPDPAVQKQHMDRVLDIAAENIWTINIATPPPQLVVVRKDFKNVPKNALWGVIFASPANAGIETYCFENPKESPGAIAETKEAIEKVTPRPPASGASVGKKGGSRVGSIVRTLIISIVMLSLLLTALRHPFIARRLLIMVPTLLIISVAVFWIIQLPPGDFLTSKIIQLQAAGDPSDLKQIDDLRVNFHFEDPAWKLYLRWMGFKWFTTFDSQDTGLLQGNMGRSMETSNPVNDMVGDVIVLTIALSLGTIAFTWATALPIGIYSAVKQYSWSDYALTLIGFVGMSVPAFLLALVLMAMSDVSGLFSPEYASQPEWSYGKLVDLMKHIWIPVVVLGVGGTAGMIRVMRANLLDELRKPYVVTARAKGVRPVKLLVKYPVRLALNPFISGIGSIFPHLISGGSIVSIVLSLPTAGKMQLDALMTEDMYLAASMLMVLSLLGVLGTLVSDLLLLWLDPRIRLEGGSR